MAYPDGKPDGWLDGELDVAVVLNDDDLKEISQYRQDFHQCKTDEDKFQLITKKRDDLLQRHANIECLSAAYDPIFRGSAAYGALKDGEVTVDDVWKRYMQIAKDAKTRLTCLEAVGSRWGRAVLQHYQWPSRPLKFCKLLRGVAIALPEWRNARDGLNSLMLKLHQTPGHCLIEDSPSPIRQTHLDKLRASKDTIYRPLVAQELPHGFGFDEFGILVRVAYAAALGDEDTAAAAQEPVDTNEGNNDTPSSAEQVVETTGEPPQPMRTGENRVDTARLLLSLQGATGLPGPVDESAEPRLVRAPSPGDSSDLSSALSSPPDSPTTASSSATNVSAPCHRENTEPGIQASESAAALHGADGQDASHSAVGNCGFGAAQVDVPLLRTLRPASNSNKNNIIQHRYVRTPRKEQSRCKRGSGTNNHRDFAQKKDKAAPVQRGLDVERLKTLARDLSYVSTSGRAASTGIPVVPMKRERAASLPPEIPQPHTPKRHQIVPPASASLRGHNHSALPVCDWVSDEKYLDQALSEISQQATENPNSRGCQTARCLRPILSNCKHPNTDEDKGVIELHLLSGYQAKILLDSGTPHVPIITEQQQHFQWANTPPIPDFFEWIEDLDRIVSVQIPSLEADKCSYEPRSMRPRIRFKRV